MSSLNREIAARTLQSLRSRARELKAEHDQAAIRFRQDSAVGDVLVGVGVQWLEDEFGIPASASRNAAARLRARWRESQEYKLVGAKVEQLLADVQNALRAAFARPPSLRAVHRAAMLHTKLRWIETVLLSAIEKLETPAQEQARQRIRRKIPSRSTKPYAAKADLTRAWPEWLRSVAAFSGLVGLVFAVSVGRLGIEIALATGFGVASVVVGLLIALSRVRTRRLVARQR